MTAFFVDAVANLEQALHQFIERSFNSSRQLNAQPCLAFFCSAVFLHFCVFGVSAFHQACVFLRLWVSAFLRSSCSLAFPRFCNLVFPRLCNNAFLRFCAARFCGSEYLRICIFAFLRVWMRMEAWTKTVAQTFADALIYSSTSTSMWCTFCRCCAFCNIQTRLCKFCTFWKKLQILHILQRSHGRLVIFAFVAFSFFCTRVCTCESNYTSAVLRFWGSAILPSFCSWASACLFFCVLCVAALLRFFVSVFYALLLIIMFVVAFLRFYVSAILRFCGFAFLRFSGAQACSEQKKQHIHAYQNKFCTFCKPIGFSFAKRNSPFCQNKQFYKLQILQNKILQILQKQTNLVNLANSANQKQNHPQILKKYTKINSAILQTLPNNKFGKLFGNSPFCKFCTVRLKIPQILHFSVFEFLFLRFSRNRHNASKKLHFRKHAQNKFCAFCQPIEFAFCKHKFAEFCENKQFL